MPVEIVTVPCLSDNYAFLVHDPDSGETALVDVPEAAPIAKVLGERGWTLSEVWITHHHSDHVQGLSEILSSHPAKVTGAAADAKRLPDLDREVGDGDSFEFAGQPVEVMDVSGHTVGHIAFHMPRAEAVFTADSLMALGCGRLFEGSAEQMWTSLSKLAGLPPDTMVYSGHEYTQSNGKFAQTIEPENPDLISRINKVDRDRAHDRPTVPSTLSLELATNPFLRASNPDIRARLDMQDATDAEVFAEIRARKDAF
ncbi:hydroxyacylglutathione hydrolase [Sulfitobacter sp. D35]|uniref:hydroxyacylglutathione hydrolase n=1 Tax=Sulfitobacter sp. D35 TaxID=3083252 RepID=UPI00296FA29E|nr:hydroxyacylglutathione hydrolase [Sulfitobacter sp. D35]MDW4499813.1 hydroxyacylglutathione hydrolase [Sulfitobacter sp. D35]